MYILGSNEVSLFGRKSTDRLNSRIETEARTIRRKSDHQVYLFPRGSLRG